MSRILEKLPKSRRNIYLLTMIGRQLRPTVLMRNRSKKIWCLTMIWRNFRLPTAKPMVNLALSLIPQEAVLWILCSRYSVRAPNFQNISLQIVIIKIWIWAREIQRDGSERLHVPLPKYSKNYIFRFHSKVSVIIHPSSNSWFIKLSSKMLK